MKNEKKQQRQNLHTKRSTVVGRGDAGDVTAVLPPDRDYFLWRVHKNDSEEKVGKYIKKKGLIYRGLVKVSNEEATFNSVKLTVSKSDVPKVLNPDTWAKGWCVHKWNEKTKSKNKVQSIDDEDEDDQNHSVIHETVSIKDQASGDQTEAESDESDDDDNQNETV